MLNAIMTEELKQAILQWDVRSWSTALSYWERVVQWKKDGRALELGANQGGLSLWMALHAQQVLCSDLEGVEERASALHQSYSVREKIEYANLDALNIPYENHFDIIVFKSILGGIGRNDNKQAQERVFQEIYKALKPGGILLFAENIEASPVHRFFRRRFVRWGRSWRYVRVPELERCLEPFSAHAIHTNGFAATFGRSEKQRRILSWLDTLLFNFITPRNWRYIAYGFARK